MKILPLVALLLMLAGLTSCYTPAKMDITYVRFRCRFVVADVQSGDNLASSSSCDRFFQDHLCDQYANTLRMSFENRESCINACTAVSDRSSGNWYTTICSRFIHRGKTICQQYCRQHYEYSGDRAET